jgi:hypothetical protein
MSRAALFLGLFLFIVQATGQSRPGPRVPPAVQPSAEHPFYWEVGGRTRLLLGGSDDDNLFQWPDAELREQLDRLSEAGGNYLRNTMSDRFDRGFEVYPFLQRTDGKYDLEQWNAEYWRRFERFLDWTATRDIVVQVEVWDRFDYSREHWLSHPYNPRNNVNYSTAGSGLAPEYPNHPGTNEQPFFYTTPSQRDNDVVLMFQRRFVDRLLQASLEYDHVLYCIDNETKGDPAWGRFWATYIKGKASERGRTVYVTEMWDDWDIKADRHRQTLDHPELYGFVDLSQNNHNKGLDHWRSALWAREYLAAAPRPINAVKTYGADGNKFGHSDQDGVERFFRHILAGFAAVRFHRPDSGLGLGEKAVAAIRAARRLESGVEPWRFRPRQETLDAGSGNHAYVVDVRGDDREWVLYLPNGGTVRPEVPPGRYRVDWIDGSGMAATPAEATLDAESSVLTAPVANHAIAVIRPAEMP